MKQIKHKCAYHYFKETPTHYLVVKKEVEGNKPNQEGFLVLEEDLGVDMLLKSETLQPKKDTGLELLTLLKKLLLLMIELPFPWKETKLEQISFTLIP